MAVAAARAGVHKRQIGQNVPFYGRQARIRSMAVTMSKEAAAEHAEVYYGTIVNRLHEAHDDAESCMEFIEQILKVLGGTTFITGMLAVVFSIDLMMIYFGMTNLSNCPAAPKVPTYLLIGGASGIVEAMILGVRNRRMRREEQEMYEGTVASMLSAEQCHPTTFANEDYYTTTSTKITELVLALFITAWFMCGNVWVFEAYKPNFHPPMPDPMNWCKQSVYSFAVFQICLTYCLAVLFLTVLITMMCCVRVSRNRIDQV